MSSLGDEPSQAAQERPGHKAGEPGMVEQLEELRLLGQLVKTLRNRCPWDRRQTHESLAPHLIEEAYEAADSIADLPDPPSASPAAVDHFEEEMGDVLFQVFLHCEIASEEGIFDLAGVVRMLREKLVDRHPHVFGDVQVSSAEEVASRWEVLKRAERERKGEADSVPVAMPALALATKLLARAQSLEGRLPPASQQAARLEDLLAVLSAESGPDRPDGEAAEDAAEVVGEALLLLSDLSRRLGVDPEVALRKRALRLRGVPQ